MIFQHFKAYKGNQVVRWCLRSYSYRGAWRPIYRPPRRLSRLPAPPGLTLSLPFPRDLYKAFSRGGDNLRKRPCGAHGARVPRRQGLGRESPRGVCSTPTFNSQWPRCSKVFHQPRARPRIYDRASTRVSSRLTQATLPRTPYLPLFSSIYSLFQPRPKRDHVPPAEFRVQSLFEPSYLQHTPRPPVSWHGSNREAPKHSAARQG